MRAVGFLALVWAWDYLTGGANWVEGICGQGERLHLQSPIELPEPTPEPGRKLVHTYPMYAEPVKLVANEHTLAVTFPENYKGGFADVMHVEDIRTGGNVYRLRQMTMHAPGEHKYGEQIPRLEVQFMHEQGFNIGAISIPFVDGGPSSKFLSVLLESELPSVAWAEADVNFHGDWPIAELIEGTTFDTYAGSLTEPPCEQNVQWYVRSKPLAVSHEQLQAFEAAIQKLSPPRGNARSVQPLMGRTVNRIVTQPWESEETLEAVQSVQLDLDAIGVSEEADPIVKSDILSNPAFSGIFADDSEVLQSTKIALGKAAQDVAGAETGLAAAKANLGTQESLYAAAEGFVGKITMMWNVLGAKQGYEAAVALRVQAVGAYAKALEETLTVVNAEVEKAAASGESSATTDSLKAALEEVKKQKALAAAAQEKSQKAIEALGGVPEPFDLEAPTALPGHMLKYRMRGDAKGERTIPAPVAPVQHEAHNPFDPTVAERVVRIGNDPSQQTRSYPRLRANLRQPEAARGIVPDAVLTPVDDAAANATDATAAETSTADAGAAAAALLHPPSEQQARRVEEPTRAPRPTGAKAWWER